MNQLTRLRDNVVYRHVLFKVPVPSKDRTRLESLIPMKSRFAVISYLENAIFSSGGRGTTMTRPVLFLEDSWTEYVILEIISKLIKDTVVKRYPLALQPFVCEIKIAPNFTSLYLLVRTTYAICTPALDDAKG